MALVELTSDERDLLTQAFHDCAQLDPHDRGFTIRSHGKREAGTHTVVGMTPDDDERWTAAAHGLVEKGMLQTVDLNAQRFRLTRGGVQRAAEMNLPPVPL